MLSSQLINDSNILNIEEYQQTGTEIPETFETLDLLEDFETQVTTYN